MSAVALGGKVGQTPGEGTLHSSVGKCPSLGGKCPSLGGNSFLWVC